MSQWIDPDAFNAFEADGWDERASTYQGSFVPLTNQLIGPLLQAAAVVSGTRLLDVGCGPGHLAAAAAGRGAAATGVDVADAMVAQARSLHPHVQFLQGGAEDLPFPNASFDAVAANFLLPHLGRPERAAAEMRRVLSPGGKVALSTWDLPAASRIPGLFFDAVQQAGASAPPDLPNGPPFYRFAIDAEFSRLLADAGLVQVRVSTVTFIHHVVGDLFDCLWDGTVRARALVAGQPAAERARIRAVLDRLILDYLSDGGLDLPISVKVASATRQLG